MKKKKLLSVLCLFLVLLMLPFSSFAEVIEEALPETDTSAVTESNSDEAATLSTAGTENPEIDLSEYNVDVINGEVYINGKKADDVISEAVVADVENTWGSGDKILLEILGILFDLIWEDYKDNKFSTIGTTVIEELATVSAQLSAIQEQISKSTKEIIAEVDYQAMVSRYNEIDKYLGSFMNDYFGNEAEAKRYISVIENIKKDEYKTPAGKDKIDQTLHKAYSYYDLSFEPTSPITGYRYTKTYEQKICKDLLEMGKYLLGQGFSTKKSNVFQLYQGICSHVYGFNTETLEVREKPIKISGWLMKPDMP